MPGVPKEMKIMFARDVLPVIEKAGGGAAICSRTIHTFGQGESAIAEMLGDLMKRDRNPSVGTTVSGGVVSLRVNSRFETRERAQQEMERICRECEQKVGDLIYGCDHELLQAVVGKLLTERDETVTTAESCTGGLLAKMLTDVSGSSTYFRQGWVTYSNKAKQERLGVSENLLNMYGAVSEPVTESMATNARRLAKADYALSISGVAGPTGGTPAKPVGMVCISLAHEKGVLNRTFNFPGDREWVRDRSAKMALTMLRYHLIGKSMPF
jgi:nicotinamide-nucleotide amidase